MSIRVSLADFIVRTDEGWISSDHCEALDRFQTKKEKDLKEAYKNDSADRADIRKQMFLTPITSKRITQCGGVPLREIRTGTTIPSATRILITDWLLEMFNDEDAADKIEEYITKNFPDVFFSADKCSRLAERLECKRDLIHTRGFNVLCATVLATNSTIATEGKCQIVRATEDAIIAVFNPVPEHLCIGAPKMTFWKAFPIKFSEPMVYGVKALYGISGRSFIMNHGHGHLRTVPYSEIASALRSFAKKDSKEIQRIKSDPLTPNAGDKFMKVCDMLLQKEKIENIIAMVMKSDKK